VSSWAILVRTFVLITEASTYSPVLSWVGVDWQAAAVSAKTAIAAATTLFDKLIIDHSIVVRWWRWDQSRVGSIAALS
jgi:hypothetical protein